MGTVVKSVEGEFLDRWEYQEILLARMAGGDLYANEARLKMRRVDLMLDRLRDKPLYPPQPAADKKVD